MTGMGWDLQQLNACLVKSLDGSVVVGVGCVTIKENEMFSCSQLPCFLQPVHKQICVIQEQSFVYVARLTCPDDARVRCINEPIGLDIQTLVNQHGGEMFSCSWGKGQNSCPGPSISPYNLDVHFVPFRAITLLLWGIDSTPVSSTFQTLSAGMLCLVLISFNLLKCSSTTAFEVHMALATDMWAGLGLTYKWGMSPEKTFLKLPPKFWESMDRIFRIISHFLLETACNASEVFCRNRLSQVTEPLCKPDCKTMFGSLLTVFGSLFVWEQPPLPHVLTQSPCQGPFLLFGQLLGLVFAPWLVHVSSYNALEPERRKHFEFKCEKPRSGHSFRSLFRCTVPYCTHLYHKVDLGTPLFLVYQEMAFHGPVGFSLRSFSLSLRHHLRSDSSHWLRFIPAKKKKFWVHCKRQKALILPPCNPRNGTHPCGKSWSLPDWTPSWLGCRRPGGGLPFAFFFGPISRERPKWSNPNAVNLKKL